MPIPSVQRKKTYGPRGLANVEVHEDRVTVEYEKSGELLSFPTNDPEAILAENVHDGTLYVQVSKDKTKLLDVRPARGTFIVKVKGFAKRKDQEPTPRHYEGMGTKANGETFPYKYDGFTVLLEVAEGEKWMGTTIPCFLRYLFVDAGDGTTAGVKVGTNHAETLVNFLELAGLDPEVDTIPYSENVLPWLEQTLIDRGKVFMVIVDDAFVEGFAPKLEL